MALVWDYPGRPVPEETFIHSHPLHEVDDIYILPVTLHVWRFKGQHKKKTKQPDSAADEHAEWQGAATSKLLSSYSPETAERFSAFQSVKHEVGDTQEPPSILSRWECSVCVHVVASLDVTLSLIYRIRQLFQWWSHRVRVLLWSLDAFPVCNKCRYLKLWMEVKALFATRRKSPAGFCLVLICRLMPEGRNITKSFTDSTCQINKFTFRVACSIAALFVAISLQRISEGKENSIYVWHLCVPELQNYFAASSIVCIWLSTTLL